MEKLRKFQRSFLSGRFKYLPNKAYLKTKKQKTKKKRVHKQRMENQKQQAPISGYNEKSIVRCLSVLSRTWHDIYTERIWQMAIHVAMSILESDIW